LGGETLALAWRLTAVWGVALALLLDLLRRRCDEAAGAVLAFLLRLVERDRACVGVLLTGFLF